MVIFIHGGCWLAEYDIAHVGAIEQAIADEGYAVWSLEYRRVGNRGGDGPGRCSTSGTARTTCAPWRHDTRSISPASSPRGTRRAGSSRSGWRRASLPETSALWMEDPLPIHGVLGLAPAADLEGLHRAGTCGGAVGRLMGGSPARHPERYRAASPMQLAPIRAEQAVIVGAHDQTWSPAGRAYVDRARQAGDAAVRLVVAPESGHFELIAPRSTTWPLVRDTLRTLLEALGR